MTKTIRLPLAALAIAALIACGTKSMPDPTPVSPDAALQEAVKYARVLLPLVCKDADPEGIVRECVTAPMLVDGRLPSLPDIKACVLNACGYRPTVQPPTVPPTAPPTTAPTAASPTAAPSAAPAWKTTLLYHNGFGGCNPYPCDPTTPACAAILDEHGRQAYPVRTTCSGDRTAWFRLPGFDRVPKGAGCYDEPGGPCRPSCSSPDCGTECNKCLGNDSPGTPCGHAPSCDDHVSCRRNFVGCGCDVLGLEACQSWDAASPRPGSRLTFTGASCEDGGGFAFHCDGAPGTPFSVCSEPWPDARTADGRPIPGGEKHCAAGWF